MAPKQQRSAERRRNKRKRKEPVVKKENEDDDAIPADALLGVFEYLPSIKDLCAMACVNKALWKPTAER